MSIKPFLKWAGGKRWLVDRAEFRIPRYDGRYIEPFLGGGAVFFHHRPAQAILSDINSRLVETYCAIRDDWHSVWVALSAHQLKHSKTHYYTERSAVKKDISERAAQFLYLNRACWNGLYRENLKGEFNVPIGTKSNIILDSDDFEESARILSKAEITSQDFELTIDQARSGDFIFVDPPYTTAHNYNGFVKYNQSIFDWDGQIRLRDSLVRANSRGASILVTNANHKSIHDLYGDHADIYETARASVISGKSAGRQSTSEAIIVFR
ncbi:Dam family site-specific DNA-(adenine-N6)-methyltransferase [Mesorhizobium sp. B2-7-2]|uniref:DNA adenine methylase n=1 Tax=Mesorhizobium sp. B2-7-2 TaxID=2589908 RepID=UPI001FEDA3B2|nr:Dam family site-specific DNA-(adenine-N6)-methyltransferase [Mesorhizobium sp. B2-7-2]